MSHINSHAESKRSVVLRILLVVSVCSSVVNCNPAFSFRFHAIEQSSLHTPTEEKLKIDSVEETSTNKQTSKSTSPLSPVKLEEGKQPNSKPPLESGLINKAKKVNIMPVPLIETDDEVDKRTRSDLEFERSQLSALWEATISRSPDIQFVVQKLMPSSDRNRTTTLLMRMISASISSVASTTPMVFGANPLAIVTSQLTNSAINQVLTVQDSKTQNRVQLDQGQAIMLYQMVRSIADKVTENYRDYKLRVRSIDTTQIRSLKLQNLIQETRPAQDAIRQIEMEYWLDRARTDIEEAVYIARRYRQSLVDLAGTEAVSVLDQSFQEQLLAEKDAASASTDEIRRQAKEAEKSKVVDPTHDDLKKLLQPSTR